jgi:3-hydroxypropanoate dehydrogenase
VNLAMNRALDSAALETLFRSARSYNGWLPDPISEAAIRDIYELARMGPTSANSNPARFVWAHSKAAKEKVAACVLPGNQNKVLTAPVVAIIGFDADFHQRFDYLTPFAPTKFRDHFAANEQDRYDTAFRNSSLQGAYLMLAARALGYDCGPISGFNHTALNQAFFAGTTVRANFICGIGHGAKESVMERLPRFAFEQASTIV